MTKPQGFEFKKFDFDVVWSALGRSAKLNNYLKKISEDLESEATKLALIEARDEGYYADLFESEVVTTKKLKDEIIGTYQKRRVRSNRINAGKNRILDINGDVDGNKYDGFVGIVYNTNFKSVWVEYGSIAKSPRFILTRSAEKIANQNGLEFEKLYFNTHEQNLSELSSKVSQAQTGKKRPRKGK